MKGCSAGVVIISALIGLAVVAGEWRIFQGQKNGLVKEKLFTDVEAFRSKPLSGSNWANVWYHEMNLSGGTVICVSMGITEKEANGYLAVEGVGRESFSETFVINIKDVAIDPEGFGLRFGPHRIKLDGENYLISLNFENTRAEIRYHILAPSYNFGDSTVIFPDGKSYVIYNLPIPWAEVRVDLERYGKKERLSGWGSMNQDNAMLSAFKGNPRWRAFWFYDKEFGLDVVDFNPNDSFGDALVQRLVFADEKGRLFTSTNYELTWDDWVEVPDKNFRYPRHYKILAEAGEDKVEAEIKLEKVVLATDLFSNLSGVVSFIARHITKNGWTYDFWCSYTLTTTLDGETDVRKGSGAGRWVALEE